MTKMVGTCEFCGKEKELGEATPFHGFYCRDCLKMNIQYDKDVLKNMKSQRKKSNTKEELERLEKEKDEALADLINFGR